MIDYDGEIRQDIANVWREFFERYYSDEIARATEEGQDSLWVDYSDILAYNPDLTDDLRNQPEKMLAHGEEALTTHEVDALDTTPPEDITLRVGNVNETVYVSDLRSRHKGKYLGLKGQVSQTTQVQPRAISATFRCERCTTEDNDFTLGPIKQHGDEIQPPLKCPGCDRNGPFTIEDETTIDHQIIELSDEPSRTMGTTDYTVPVHLYGDLAGNPKPGDRIQVNGFITTERDTTSGNTPTRRPWKIEARAIEKEEVAFEEITPERKEEIKALANADDTIEQLIQSVAPELVSPSQRDRQTKLAVLLQMAGAVRDGDRRGDINLFLIGDKGTGKSHLLDRANELAPKSVKVSGKGASAAGLTATAKQTDYGGWMLDAGALVMADGGIAAIDEFDKMKESARKSMHEAMESQEVPINKAGINTVLRTRTAVLAAANPTTGEFDRYTPLHDQINLEAPLISRFDLVFAIMDTVEEDRDRQIAQQQYAESDNDQPVDDDLLKQYLAYARNNIYPEYSDPSVREELINYYVDKRQEAADSDTDESPFGPRMNDALRRLAQASARLRLSEEITMADVERAISLMNRHIGDIALDEDGNIDGSKASGYGSESIRKQVMDFLDDKSYRYPSQIAQEANISEEKARSMCEKLHSKYNPPKVEEKNGKYRQA